MQMSNRVTNQPERGIYSKRASRVQGVSDAIATKGTLTMGTYQADYLK